MCFAFYTLLNGTHTHHCVWYIHTIEDDHHHKCSVCKWQAGRNVESRNVLWQPWLPQSHSLFTLSKIFAANFSEQVVESFPSDISTGIYYGWACVGSGDVHKMVLSIGWNPFYRNTKKSVVRTLLCVALLIVTNEAGLGFNQDKQHVTHKWYLEVMFALRNAFGISFLCLYSEKEIVRIARKHIACR